MVFVSKESRINAWNGNETDPDAVTRYIYMVMWFLGGKTK
jgi:hypothetical protein